MKREIRLHPIQHDFVQCPDLRTAFIGGIGSGKSFAGAVKALMHCSHYGLGMVVAPTFSMLRDSTWRTYQEVCGDAILSFNKGEFLARIGGAEVLFRSADNPDRLRGPNLDWAHIDEAALCPEGTWEIVIGRLRAGGKARPIWVTSTPRGRNWLWRCRDQLTVFTARTSDNPYLDPAFVKSLEASYQGAFAQQELDGQFVAFEGLVYEEFSREVHVADRDGPWREVVIGCDEGYTNPAVLLAVGTDGDGRAHVIEEFYQRQALQATVIQEARRMVEIYRAQAICIDPSAPGLIADMVGAGLPAKAANRDVFAGIQSVKARLARQGDGRPRLTVSPSCVNTIAEFESYCWVKGREGARDEPQKVNDHAMDALRYAVMELDASSSPDAIAAIYGYVICPSCSHVQHRGLAACERCGGPMGGQR